MSRMPKGWDDYAGLAAFIKGECACCRGKGRCIVSYMGPVGDTSSSVPPYHVPSGPSARSWASDHCPGWAGGGWCSRYGLPKDPKRRRNCVLLGCEPGSPGCDYFEQHLLLDAPEAVFRDYAFRVARPPEGLIATEGECIVLRDTPVQCRHFNRSLLPACPEHIASEYHKATKQKEESDARERHAQRSREGKGAPRDVRHQSSRDSRLVRQGPAVDPDRARAVLLRG